MCLLVTQSADVKFDDDFLKGVYQKNGDGIGVMFSENNKLMIRKFLPKTEAQFIAFYREHIEGRDCSWHARMRTHGDIDMDNCHPYPVLTKEDGYPLYLAHNGVLHTGNKADTKKSDTWHFINDFLRPMLTKNPEFFMHPAFIELVGEYIGSGNKFVLLDAHGNMVTVNREQGVEHNGAWLSNTYAWDTFGTKFQSKYAGFSGSWGGYARTPSLYSSKGGLNDDGDDDGWYTDWKKQFGGLDDEDTKLLSERVADSVDEDLDDEVDFLCEFFDVVRAADWDEDLFGWNDMSDFYQLAGSSFCWALLEDISDDIYDQDETLAVIASFKDTPDEPFPSHQTQSAVNKEVTV